MNIHIDKQKTVRFHIDKGGGGDSHSFSIGEDGELIGLVANGFNVESTEEGNGLILS